MNIQDELFGNLSPSEQAMLDELNSRQEIAARDYAIVELVNNVYDLTRKNAQLAETIKLLMGNLAGRLNVQ